MPSIARNKELNRLTKTAIEAALAAGNVLKRHFRKTLDVREKVGAGLVTQVDVAAEKTSIRILKKAFPKFSFLAEESGQALSGPEANGRWIIDPLDGTTNYVHGFPMFCVSIAAEWEGALATGVIYHPILKELYVAVQGQGATLNGKKIRVSKTPDIRQSLLTTGFSYQQNSFLHEEMAAFEKLSASARAIRRPGSAALDLAYNAQGVFDGFWERHLSPWDVAAGVLLVREAGGRVTDFNGVDFAISSPQVLATNGAIHEELITVLRSARKS